MLYWWRKLVDDKYFNPDRDVNAFLMVEFLEYVTTLSREFQPQNHLTFTVSFRNKACLASLQSLGGQ